MLDGVLDERLHGEGRHRRLQRLLGDVHLYPQPISEPGLLDGEVALDEPQLGRQRHEPLAGRGQHVAEQTREGLDGGLCLLGLLGDEGGDGVERVEEKMGVDLGTEGREFGLGGAADQAALPLQKRQPLRRQGELRAQRFEGFHLLHVVDREAPRLAPQRDEADRLARVAHDGDGERDPDLAQPRGHRLGELGLVELGVARPDASGVAHVVPGALQLGDGEEGRLGAVGRSAPGLAVGLAQKHDRRARCERLADDENGLVGHRAHVGETPDPLAQAVQQPAPPLAVRLYGSGDQAPHGRREPVGEQQQRDGPDAEGDGPGAAHVEPERPDEERADHDEHEHDRERDAAGEASGDEGPEAAVAERRGRDEEDRQQREQLEGHDEPPRRDGVLEGRQRVVDEERPGDGQHHHEQASGPAPGR